MPEKTVSRRVFALAGAALASFPVLARAGLLPVTPAQSEGPFYPDQPLYDRDADLVQVAGIEGQAKGTVLHLSGQIRDRSGKGVDGARVEIWQCDAEGVYRHARAGGTPDPAFQGYGVALSSPNGDYLFRTIRPAPYPGRPPHIHFKVSAPGFEPVTTQMYVRGDAGLQADPLLNAVRDPSLRERLLIDLEPLENAEPGALRGRFDIVLDGNAVIRG